MLIQTNTTLIKWVKFSISTNHPGYSGEILVSSLSQNEQDSGITSDLHPELHFQSVICKTVTTLLF